MEVAGWATDGVLTVRHGDGGERGLAAVCDVAPGDVVLRLPLDRLVTPRTAAATAPWGPALVRAAAGLSGAQWLVAFLALERTRRTAAAADDDDADAAAVAAAGRWSPYLATLPADFAHCPGHSRYPAAARALALVLHPETAELLAAQDRTRRADVDAVASAVARAGLATAIDADVLEWAWWAVNTRSIAVTLGEDGSDVPNGVALAPFLDLLNHDPAAHTVVDVDVDRGELCLRSGHASRAGQEYFICYGDHSNARLWTEYGFLIARHPRDAVDAWPALVRLVRPTTRPPQATTDDRSRLLDARQAAWARAQALGLDRDLTWTANTGEPSWTLWRVAGALALAELACVVPKTRVAVGGSKPRPGDGGKPRPGAAPRDAIAAFLLGEVAELPPEARARARALLHAMAAFLLTQLEARGADARAQFSSSVVGDAADPNAAALWRWHADRCATLAAALAASAADDRP